MPISWGKAATRANLDLAQVDLVGVVDPEVATWRASGATNVGISATRWRTAEEWRCSRTTDTAEGVGKCKNSARIAVTGGMKWRGATQRHGMWGLKRGWRRAHMYHLMQLCTVHTVHCLEGGWLVKRGVYS